MSRNFIVYQSRNRLTGTMTQTLDTKHADSTMPNKGGRYVAYCVEHKTAKRFAEAYPAGRAIAHVDEWCKRCQTMIAKGIKVVNKTTLTPPDLHAPIHNDLRMASHNNAHDKKWPTRNVATEQQRTADQPNIYVGTDKMNRKANDARNKRARATRKPSVVSSSIPLLSDDAIRELGEPITLAEARELI